MSDTNNTGDKTLSVAPSKTLHLPKRPVEQGMVRQSFSHGRSKAVVVEKVKRRIPGPGEPPAREAAAGPALKAAPAAAPAKASAPAAPAGPAKTGVVLQTLTEEQRQARARALVGARA